MADDENDALDLSTFVPETFKGEDGKYDLAKFRTEFDGLSAFKSQMDERDATLPKEAKEYAWALPEGHAFPEGFDPAKMATKDEAGNEVQFDPMAMLDADDPDVAAVQAILHEAKAEPALMAKLASVMVNREIRGIMDAEKFAAEEKAKLGDAAKAQARINTIEHTLKARLPAAQVGAILDGLTSAEAIRGMEALLKGSAATTSTAPAGKDISQMSITDRIAFGLQQREGSRS